MMELTSDPQSIRFLRGNRISLPLLKNEIDRRMLKITCLVHKMSGRRKRTLLNRTQPDIGHTQPEIEHKHTQTEQMDRIVSLNCLREESPLAVLREISQKDRENRQERRSNPKSNKENGKPARSKPHLKSEARPEKQEEHVLSSLRSRPEEQPLIESNGFTFREIEQTNEGSTDRKLIQASQDDKIFELLDFGLQISNVDLCISNVELCQSLTSEGELPCRSAVAAREPRSEAQLVSAFADLSGSELGKEASRRHRKIRMAGREVILPEPQRRIIVSQECRERMEREVEPLFARKRKEACDYKLRINVLKKIEEKYGEEYSA